MSIFNEFEERFSGRFFGRYRGVVDNIDDPKKMGRLQIKVPVVLGMDEALGWALPAPPFGGSPNVGFFACPAKGDYVWVEFEEGDPERPIWTAGPWPLGAQKQSFMPKHGKGELDLTDYSVRDFGNIPPSQFQGEYGKVVTLQGHDGSFLEFDGTDGVNRVQLSHYSGARIEMTSDGSIQEVSVGHITKRSTGNFNTEVSGNEITTVCGDRTELVNGMTYETYSKGVSQLFGLRLLNYPGLNEDNIPEAYKDAFTDPATGELIYLPSDLKQKGGSYSGKWDNSVMYRAGGQFSASAGGNMRFTSGTSFSVMSMTSVAITATETLELAGLASTYGDIGTNAISSKAVALYGYNGVSDYVSFDITGLASCSGIIADPGGSTRRPVPQPLPKLILFANMGPKQLVDTGAALGGMITLLGVPVVPAPCVFLGGTELTALSGVVTAEKLLAWLTPVIAMLASHTHAVSGAVAASSVELAIPLPLQLAALPVAVSSLSVKVAP